MQVHNWGPIAWTSCCQLSGFHCKCWTTKAIHYWHLAINLSSAALGTLTFSTWMSALSAPPLQKTCRPMRMIFAPFLHKILKDFGNVRNHDSFTDILKSSDLAQCSYNASGTQLTGLSGPLSPLKVMVCPRHLSEIYIPSIFRFMKSIHTWMELQWKPTATKWTLLELVCVEHVF